MSLLKELVLSEQSDDMSRLPQEDMRAIQGNIRKGAEDLDQQWANALELVHKAYEVEGIERPRPEMKTAWEQYEENLTYAVQQLAKNRGMDGDWRMSSSMFHEARQVQNKFSVKTISPEGEVEQIVEANNIDDVITRQVALSEYDATP